MNVYVHGGDVTASVHSLYCIKRTNLRTIFSYNIAPMTDLSTLQERYRYTLLEEADLLRGDFLTSPKLFS